MGNISTIFALDKTVNPVGLDGIYHRQNLGRRPNSKLLLAFIFLIIIQSYLVPLIGIASGKDYNKYTNYVYLHTVISYTVIVVSVIMFHDDGLEVFQDHGSLWLIVFTCFFRAGFGGSNDVIYRGILILLGLVLTNYIIRNRRGLKKPSLKSIVIALLWSIATVVVLALVRFYLDPDHGTLPSNLAAYIINMSAFQLSFGTVIEEAYFRGLLFGFLAMIGVKENVGLTIQGVLFWGMHYMKIGDPILFFILIPLFTLSATLIIKRYKMLYQSILVHTINNVFGGILVAVL